MNGRSSSGAPSSCVGLLDDRGEPSDTEAIFVRLDAGEETAAISLDREVFEAGSPTRTERSRSSLVAWSS
jgi:hypothetical protein